MKIIFHRNFKKQYKKLPKKIQKRFSDRFEIFLKDNNHPLLNIHLLHGQSMSLKSMNVTGDYRALFVKKKSKVTFYHIGTHSELYE
ncbi:MAG: type II toxin-antitoxin system mRNA interferase toxin, RelE/StbE family [Candidatus Paceibacterota bacterium]